MEVFGWRRGLVDDGCKRKNLFRNCCGVRSENLLSANTAGLPSVVCISFANTFHAFSKVQECLSFVVGRGVPVLGKCQLLK